MRLQFGPSLCIDEGCSLTFGQTSLFPIYSKHKGTVVFIIDLPWHALDFESEWEINGLHLRHAYFPCDSHVGDATYVCNFCQRKRKRKREGQQRTNGRNYPSNAHFLNCCYEYEGTLEIFSIDTSTVIQLKKHIL